MDTETKKSSILIIDNISSPGIALAVAAARLAAAHLVDTSIHIPIINIPVKDAKDESWMKAPPTVRGFRHKASGKQHNNLNTAGKKAQRTARKKTRQNQRRK